MNFIRSILSGCMLAICLFHISGCKEKEIKVERLFCDAETVEGKRFVCHGEYFDNGNLRTDEMAYSGKYSVMLNKNRKYGMTYRINDVQEGERFIVRVKRYSETGSGSLILSAQEVRLGYFVAHTPTTTKVENGWMELSLDVVIAQGVDSISVYLFNPNDEPVYFDDLEIIRMPKFDPIYPDLQVLQIHVNDLDMAEMTRLREYALRKGVIDGDAKKEFRCVVSYEGDQMGATIRFKGDWTDHLMTRKWSFRIEMDGEGRVLGKKTFSIQHPETRGFANEWLIHQLLHREEVLTTAYDFIPVELNGKNLGIYAFEEHFEKQLLESQNRREGVIMKFDEEFFWKFRHEHGKPTEKYLPLYQTTYIKPFNRKKVKRSKALNRQFLLGRDLCEMYWTMHPDVDVYLDIDRYTKYLAILTIVNSATHTIHWHNQRWYANPVTAKIEPVAFDFSDHFEYGKEENDFLEMLKDRHEDDPIDLILTAPFRSAKMKEQYLKNLERMLEPNYLDSTFKEMESEIKMIDTMLSKEFTGKYVETETIKKHAERVRDELPEIRDLMNAGYVIRNPDTTNRRIGMHPSISAQITLRVYSKESGGYVAENSAGHEVVIYGYKKRKHADTLFLDRPVRVGVSNWRHNRSEIITADDLSEVYYRMDDIGFRGVADVSDRPIPRPYSPRLSLSANMKSGFPTFIKKEKNLLRIEKGEHLVNELIYIPSGKKLIIEAGAMLTLGAGGGIISESSVSFAGNSREQIVIKADSKNNHGITVLNAASELDNVRFEGLNRLSYKGWELTGSVNFYECDVIMQNCTISNSRSEDALNIIRSEFELQSCHIANSRSDGFDSDFSHGTISNCSFKDIGNDAVDFSGSKVDIVECVMTEVGDKAISAGEESTVSIRQVEIDGAVIGIAAKDRSHASLADANISHCDYGYVAYTKKSEYGGATIEVSNVELKHVKNESDIELNSTLILDSLKISGTDYSSVSKY